MFFQFNETPMWIINSNRDDVCRDNVEHCSDRNTFQRYAFHVSLVAEWLQ